MLPYERVILQMRIRSAYPIDFFHLAGGEVLAGIKTPASGEKSLAAEDLVDAWNAAAKLVYGVEDGGVGVGDLPGEG